MSWGRGWEVGVRKAIYEHERAREIAAEILASEHGVKHQSGERKDLCPVCQFTGAPHVATSAIEVTDPASGLSGEAGAP